jgi:hypothetical protein
MNCTWLCALCIKKSIKLSYNGEQSYKIICRVFIAALKTDIFTILKFTSVKSRIFFLKFLVQYFIKKL